MLDVCVSRKNKVNLADYDYKLDIRNRMVMSTLNAQDVEALEEILYGSIRIPLLKLRKNLDLSEAELLNLLSRLKKTNLFEIDQDSIIVDKEMRKYYEYQIMKYDEDFKPNMNYIQGLLKKVPIHVLPVWYSVPRSSNNIFASMIERYFKTPQIYERYLLDLNLVEPIMAGIVSELFNTKDLKLSVTEVQRKYSLTREAFEEYILHLEFNFVCCVNYERVGDQYVEIITPFQEWADFLRFRTESAPKSISQCSAVIKKGADKDFHFIQDMVYLLEEIIHHPLALKSTAADSDFLFDEELVKQLIVGLGHSVTKETQLMTWQLHFSRIASRLVRIGLAMRHEEMLCPHHNAPHWLNMEMEDKALYLYRHPNNRTLQMGFSQKLDTEKNVKEVERSLERITMDGWYDMDEFLKGVTCAIGDNEPVTLAKEGLDWVYKRPSYQEDELQFMRYVIMQRLYEVGMVDVGVCHGKDCFRLLPFGRETLC